MNYTRSSWVIYYNDESTFSNEDGKPEDAPKTGVLAVCHFTVDNRRQIEASKDFYYWDPTPVYKDESGGTFYGCDIAGLYQYLFAPGWKCVFFGAIVHDVIWRRMLERITSEFPEALDFKTKLPQPLDPEPREKPRKRK
jgi:hypothetical protein